MLMKKKSQQVSGKRLNLLAFLVFCGERSLTGKAADWLSEDCGFKSHRSPHVSKSPVEVGAPAGELTRTAEAVRSRKTIIRPILCGFNRRFRTWSVITAKLKLR